MKAAKVGQKSQRVEREFGKRDESGMKGKAVKRGSERGCDFVDDPEIPTDFWPSNPQNRGHQP